MCSRRRPPAEAYNRSAETCTSSSGRARAPRRPDLLALVELALFGITQLFFLDEATGLAAGHRPCGECRSHAYRAFKSAWSSAHRLPGAEPKLSDGADNVPGGRATRRGLTEMGFAERAAAGGVGLSFNNPDAGRLGEARWYEVAPSSAIAVGRSAGPAMLAATRCPTAS